MSTYYVSYLGFRVTDVELRNRSTPAAREIIRLSHLHKNKAGPLCYCKYPHGSELVARLDTTGQCCVARKRGDRGGHMDDCAFGQPAHPTCDKFKKAISVNNGVIEAFVSVKLIYGDVATTSEKKPELQISGAVGHQSQARTTADAIFNQLVLINEINRWEPGMQRDSSSVFGSFRSTVNTSCLNNKSMAETIYIPVMHDAKSCWEKVRTRLIGFKNRKKNYRKGIVLFGEIHSFRKSRGEINLRLVGIDECFILSKSQFKEMCKNFPRVWRRLKKFNSFLQNCKVVFLGVISMDSSGVAHIESFSVRLMSLQFIPVDSYNEVKVTHKLVNEGRKFFRVLSVVDEDTNFEGDFELLDMKLRWVLEVFGINSIKYIEDMNKKIEFWEDVIGCKLWKWCAYKNKKIITPFPPAET